MKRSGQTSPLARNALLRAGPRQGRFSSSKQKDTFTNFSRRRGGRQLNEFGTPSLPPLAMEPSPLVNHVPLNFGEGIGPEFPFFEPYSHLEDPLLQPYSHLGNGSGGTGMLGEPLFPSTAGNGFEFSKPDDPPGLFGADNGLSSIFSNLSTQPGINLGGMAPSAGFSSLVTPEITVLEKTLRVSLEEIFRGTTKKAKVTRTKTDSITGEQVLEDRILDLPIKPGLKAGSKIIFRDAGDQVDGKTQDLHFIIEEVSSPTFVCVETVTHREL
jgi:hypothetical protein